ncbi:MAG: OsmC family peroxiredoxin, partial [Bacteroidales bacterium]|nr:OsmC family peroxiredoxin [Bacteroidales bacterium]
MKTSNIIYIGGLRTKATQLLSGNQIVTDAPPDNKGKGEAFSPTDLLATALGARTVGQLGCAANEHG